MIYEVEEKRQLIKLTLQNLQLDGKKVNFELVKPFDKVSACSNNQTGSTSHSMGRTADIVFKAVFAFI